MDDEPPEAVPITSREVTNANSNSRVPVTLITGFLGAGKTTLVNHILSQPHGYKIAVILNDFGDNLGIESALVQKGASSGAEAASQKEPVVEEWVEVGNGCICCSVKHSFVIALEQLLERRDRFDYILLETTGLANPGPVISMLWTDDELESPIRLDSIVTVVDGLNILKQLEQEPDGTGAKLAQMQIAYADVVILNKMDLLSSEPTQVKEIEDHLTLINSTIRIIRAERSAINVGEILNCQLFDMKASEAVLDSLADPIPRDIGSSALLDISSIHFTSGGTVDLTKLDKWLTSLLWETTAPMEILRMKGVVCADIDADGTKAFYIFQAVLQLFEITQIKATTAQEQMPNRLLVVGRHLDREGLEQGFKKCLLH